MAKADRPPLPDLRPFGEPSSNAFALGAYDAFMRHLHDRVTPAIAKDIRDHIEWINKKTADREAEETAKRDARLCECGVHTSDGKCVIGSPRGCSNNV